MASKKLDLKKIFNYLDHNDYSSYEKLSDDERNDFVPWVIMRYMSSVSGKYAEHQLISVNEIVNVDFSAIKDHKKLQWMLLADCGIGFNQNHVWIAPPKVPKVAVRTELLTKMFPHYNKEEIQLLMTKYSKDELRELMLDHGIDVKEIELFFL